VIPEFALGNFAAIHGVIVAHVLRRTTGHSCPGNVDALAALRAMQGAPVTIRLVGPRKAMGCIL
jgi:hypothetical protein